MTFWEKLKNRWAPKKLLTIYLKEGDEKQAAAYFEIFSSFIIDKKVRKILVQFDDNGHSTNFLRQVFGKLAAIYGLNRCYRKLEFEFPDVNPLLIDEVKMIMKNEVKVD